MEPLGHIDDFGFAGGKLEIQKDLPGKIMFLADIHVQCGPVNTHFPHKGRLLFYFLPEIIAALCHKTEIGAANQFIKQGMIFESLGNSNLLHKMTLLLFEFRIFSL